MLTEFDKTIKFLSDLPTERAMKEMAKMRSVPESVRNCVEIMAISKIELVKALRLMRIRERIMEHTISIYKASAKADEAIKNWIATNPDYDIQINTK